MCVCVELCSFVVGDCAGAPSIISEDMLTTFGVDIVVRGTVHESSVRGEDLEKARYRIPREKGSLRMLASPSEMTSERLIQRVVENRAAIEERQAKKTLSEQKYYSAKKAYVQEI